MSQAGGHSYPDLNGPLVPGTPDAEVLRLLLVDAVNQVCQQTSKRDLSQLTTLAMKRREMSKAMFALVAQRYHCAPEDLVIEPVFHPHVDGGYYRVSAPAAPMNMRESTRSTTGWEVYPVAAVGNRQVVQVAGPRWAPIRNSSNQANGETLGMAEFRNAGFACTVDKTINNVSHVFDFAQLDPENSINNVDHKFGPPTTVDFYCHHYYKVGVVTYVVRYLATLSLRNPHQVTARSLGHGATRPRIFQ